MYAHPLPSSTLPQVLSCTSARLTSSKRLHVSIAKLEKPPTTSVTSSPQQRNILSFLCPLLKLFGGGDPAAPRNKFLETATSGVSSAARFLWGSTVQPDIAVLASARQSLQPLQLYEFEACPFCRRVREALTELDLNADVYPCPKNSLHHRPFVKDTGGKEQFPYMIDPNTGIRLYESGDIVKYLFKTYGGGKEPSPGMLGSTMFTGWVPTLLRAGRGMNRWEHALTRLPDKKLELYSYENNQFARLVREALCELELPYVLHNAGFGSHISTKLQQLQNVPLDKIKIPFLVDPNTEAQIKGHEEILQYLFHNYSSQATRVAA